VVHFHHVNLGVPEGGIAAEAAFLVDFLGYRRIPLTPADPPSANWFESADGKQVHLSADPDHQPAARAHVAVDLGDELTLVVGKFDDAGYAYQPSRSASNPTVFCRDPAGNLWELRGTGSR
jgi:catechol 2,3-dioxygenase-like lactoylglutathione lyase family enzyme